MTASTLDIRIGLPDDARPAAATLYWEGFARKLGPVIGGARPTEIVAEALVAGQVLGAWDGERLLGIACLQDGTRPPMSLSTKSFIHEFGLVKGLWRRALSVFSGSEPPADGQLLLDTLAVSGAARGRGVGTALLDGVVAEARARGLREVRLEVVDTNPRARALYERYGFRAVRTARTPYLRRLMGFSAVTTMLYDAGQRDADASAG